MFQIEPCEPPETAVKRIFAEQLDLITTLLASPGDDFDAAIHTARKSLKRIRAILRLIRDEIGNETYRAENGRYQDAGRRLAPLRDSVVMVMTLDALRQHSQQPDAFAANHARLVNWQAAIRHQFVAETHILTEVSAALQQGKQQLLALPITKPGFDAFAGGLCRIYRQGQRLMAEAYADKQANPVLFHDWRKRVKYLWYQLEFLEPLWPPVFQEWARELHHISDLLGDAHDLAALGDWLQAEPAHFSAHQELAGLLPLLHERRRELEQMARPYGRRLYSEKPNAFVKRICVWWEIWQTTGIGGLPRQLSDGDLVSVREAAQLLALSPRQVRQQIYDGRLPAVKVGRTWVVSRTAVTTQTQNSTALLT